MLTLDIWKNNISSSYRPIFNVTYTAVPTTGHYGCATPLNQNDTSRSHCYEYALDAYFSNNYNSWYIEEDGWGNATYSVQNIENIFIPRIINFSKNSLNTNVRRIDSYDSAIFPFERRIAMRLKVGGNFITQFHYHFIRQNSDGSWSYKNFISSSGPNIASLLPDHSTYTWENGEYDSDIYYFAVSSLGGYLDYHAY